MPIIRLMVLPLDSQVLHSTQKKLSRKQAARCLLTDTTRDSQVCVPAICCLTEAFSEPRERGKVACWGGIITGVYRVFSHFTELDTTSKSPALWQEPINKFWKDRLRQDFSYNLILGMGGKKYYKAFYNEELPQEVVILKIWFICVML